MMVTEKNRHFGIISMITELRTSSPIDKKNK